MNVERLVDCEEKIKIDADSGVLLDFRISFHFTTLLAENSFKYSNDDANDGTYLITFHS